jgi:hypothetical protein
LGAGDLGAGSVMFQLQREGIMLKNQRALARRDLISILSSDSVRKLWKLCHSQSSNADVLSINFGDRSCPHLAHYHCQLGLQYLQDPFYTRLAKSR